MQAKGLPQNEALLVENAPSHPNESLLASDDGLFTGEFLPPNATAAMQPMDEGVISARKRLYRLELFKKFYS